MRQGVYWLNECSASISSKEEWVNYDIPQPPALVALIEQHQLVQGKPCAVCGCEL